MDFAGMFEHGLPYGAFLDEYGTDEHRRRWDAIHARVRLSDQQRALLHGFTQEMKVLVVAGTWCGDCVDQCPIFDCFSAECDRILIRYFDRDKHLALAEALSTCGGKRVPTVLFLSEDGYVCGRYGDRTLSKYRQMAARLSGPTCPTGLVPTEQAILKSVIQEWLNEFERIQLMLRTSSRLRKLHED